jgi:hypothetical protein
MKVDPKSKSSENEMKGKKFFIHFLSLVIKDENWRQ